jgi:hypothetical protein
VLRARRNSSLTLGVEKRVALRLRVEKCPEWILGRDSVLGIRISDFLSVG